MTMDRQEPNVTRDDFPELRGDFQDMADQFAQLLREADAQLTARDAEADATGAESDEQHAEQARAGALGPDWRVVQGRIDLGRTTLKAVFSGEDASPEAERLRAVARRNLEELRESWSAEERDEGDSAPPAPDVVFAQTLVDSRARFEQAAARIQDALNAMERREGQDNV